jgi:hypothetical protein
MFCRSLFAILYFFFWPLCCLFFFFFFFDIRILITPLIHFGGKKIHVFPLTLPVIIFSTSPKEEFEDTKGVIRIRISKKKKKKNRQHNRQKKKYKYSGCDSDATSNKIVAMEKRYYCEIIAFFVASLSSFLVCVAW